MLSKTATVLGFAAAVSAYANPAHVANQLQARQTDTAALTACASALVEFATLVPTPPAEIVSYFATNPITDPCDFTKMPASLMPAASSYQSVAISFLSAQSSKLASIVSVCPDASSVLSAVEEATLTCKAGAGSTGSATAGSGSGSETTPTAGSGSGGSGGATGTKSAGGAGATTVKSAGGARETGFVGAAIAAVGFLGVVAAL